jgi:hypothetical protein
MIFMGVSKHSVLQRLISGFLIAALITAGADVRAFARTAGGDTDARVTNQEVHVEGNVAVISYDLEAPPGGKYIITVELRRESNRDFVLIPPSLTGDAGDVLSNGARKVIKWDYLKNFPNGLAGDDYYFKISLTHPGGFPWLWVGLGTAAAAVVAIGTRKPSSGTPQPGTQELPLPPAR